jgi:SAM-dependent methyltransferase
MSGSGDDHSDRAETAAVRDRYARRATADERYRLTNPAALMAMQERQRAMLALFARRGFSDLAQLRLLEVGSGGGGNLLELLQLGFLPEHLAGIELLPERHAAARARLPEAVQLVCGDASAEPVAAASRDIVLASTVFSSLLDDAFQQRLAAAMWRWLKPGGGVLWYDFTVDNPRNPDVRGVPLARIRALFPKARIEHRRVTLAPPIARWVCRIHPAAYGLLNIPVLRTHLLGWLGKDRKQR